MVVEPADPVRVVPLPTLAAAPEPALRAPPAQPEGPQASILEEAVTQFKGKSAQQLAVEHTMAIMKAQQKSEELTQKASVAPVAEQPVIALNQAPLDPQPAAPATEPAQAE